jgi:hypothetical protein
MIPLIRPNARSSGAKVAICWAKAGEIGTYAASARATAKAANANADANSRPRTWRLPDPVRIASVRISRPRPTISSARRLVA